MNRLEVRDQILTCTQCDLHKHCTAPVPFSGTSPNRIVVQGEAPGREEDTQGRPFIGTAGQKLRSMLSEAGFTPDDLAFVNTASCWPLTVLEDDDETKPPRVTARAPSPSEVKACANNVQAQLELFQPRWVLLCGNVALQSWRPDLTISKVRGRGFLLTPDVPDYQHMFAFAVVHPSAVLRSRTQWEDVTKQDLSLFHQMVQDDTPFLLTRENCLRCDAEPTKGWEWDNNELPYCPDCWAWLTKKK